MLSTWPFAEVSGSSLLHILKLFDFSTLLLFSLALQASGALVNSAPYP
jgi:hypothetical protein